MCLMTTGIENATPSQIKALAQLRRHMESRGISSKGVVAGNFEVSLFEVEEMERFGRKYTTLMVDAAREG